MVLIWYLLTILAVCSCGPNSEENSETKIPTPLSSLSMNFNSEMNIENENEEINKIVKLPPRWCSDVDDKNLCQRSDTLDGSCKFDDEQNICKPKIERYVCGNDDRFNPTGWGGYSPEDLKSMDEPLYIDLRLGDGFEITNRIVVWLKNIEDNRCPKQNTCANNGEAVATFLLEKKEGRKEEFSLVLKDEQSSLVKLGGFEFGIATLIPYPVTAEIQEKELKLAIRFTGIDIW